MNQKIFSRFFYSTALFFGALFFAFHAANAWEEPETITPTDVYYLAKSIDDSLVAMYGLTSEFNKKRLSNNIRPRNVYEKLLSVADEFNLIHGNVIDRSRLNAAREVDILTTKPRDPYRILSLIKDYLVLQNKFLEHTESRTPKTPSDVAHLLRQISYHHVEIARKKGMVTNWSTPGQVYDAIVKDILPVVKGVANEAGLEYDDYPFPKQPLTGVIPLNVSKLLQHLYKNISEHYKTRGWYDPLVLIEINDCDDISPGDSFDFVKVISAEFKAMSGNKRLSSQTAERYRVWKDSKERIVPGDVYRLLQYNYILSKRALKKAGR
ncbi:hypothetical protein QUF72_21260 [Desulfobacterales bacterium HSG2]|nr:hypothetical protein [Desulfobacterales bacterium HSG2]